MNNTKFNKKNINSLYLSLNGTEYSETLATKVYSFNDLNETISSSKTEIVKGNSLGLTTKNPKEGIKTCEQ